MAEFEVMPIEATNVTPVQAPTPSNLIEQALRSNARVEVLERLFALQERHEANEARKKYVAALAAFKAQGLRIGKDKEVLIPNRPAYKHATLGNIIATLTPSLSENGLSATWSTAQEPHGVTVTCILRHEAGHMESVSLTAKPDSGQGRNDVQAIGSTITYLQRYTLLAITGVAASDQDDDGGGSGDRGQQYITDEQCDEIAALLHATNSDFANFLKWLKVETIATIPRGMFRRAISALEAKAKQQAAQ